MSDGSAPIRSYQRIFTPQRRIYQIDGRRLPIPGGVPLSWLGWTLLSLVVILLVSSRSLLLTLLAGLLAAAVGRQRSLPSALAAFLVAVAGVQLVGLLLGLLAWPLRLVVLPMALATAAGQLSAEGRPAYRHLLGLFMLRLKAGRRSLGRPVPVEGERVTWLPRLWMAPDHRYPVLAHGRVHGPARLVFAQEMVLTRRRGRHVVRPAASHKARRGDQLAHVVQLEAGQIVEVRP